MRLLVSLVAAAVVAGCGGSDAEPEPAFTAAGAKRVVNVRPVTPEWPAWPQRLVSNDSPDGSEVANKWKDDDKLANLVAQVYTSAARAHEGMTAFNALSREWGEEYGQVTKDEAVDGLGDEAWRLWVAGSGTQATYHWRRDNLVVEAHVHCYGDCPSDVDAATRAWVDAIDEEARRAR